jgi:NFU1 iron-sulfur cluster scaffold homolog, mitochondrial
MAFKVIEVQSTPNPNANKYLLDKPITEKPRSYFNAAAASADAVAEKLFGIAGVTSLLLLSDFVTVNKAPEAKWGTITPQVKRVLAES